MLRNAAADEMLGRRRPAPVNPKNDFVLLIQTDATATGGTSPATATNQFRFYGVGTYDIDWGDGVVQNSVSGTQTHTYASIGTYRLRVRNWRGTSRRYSSPGVTTTDAIKIRQLQQWGTTQWTSCESMFFYCVNMIGTYSDKPNLSAPNLSLQGMFIVCSVFNGSPYASMNDWDTSTVTNMFQMFRATTAFNQPIGNWNTSNVTTMRQMFQNATAFNQPLNSWNTGSVTDMALMFASSAFNQNLNSWNTSNVTNMAQMFNFNTAFNGDIGGWNTASVTNMNAMFWGASVFNKPIGTWNTGSVTNMAQMFQNAFAFNQPLNSWNTGSVTSMQQMFERAVAFNQDLNSWNTGNVTNMAFMFNTATLFNGDIGNWNTTNVTTMRRMFALSAFNKPINTVGAFWNVSNVTDMQQMFVSATAFNQPLNSWDVSNVTDMSGMFSGATAFNQDLGAWILNDNVLLNNMLDQGTIAQGMSAENYSRTLIGWANERSASGNPDSRILGASNRQYNTVNYGGTPFDTAGGTVPPQGARNYLVATAGWTINGDIAI